MAYPTRVRYGLRFLVRLAMQDESRRLSMAEIAQEEGVSVKYLEQIVALLRPLAVLRAVRGAKGGYHLECEPGDIAMDQVFASLGALEASAPCVADGSVCGRTDMCSTRPFWNGLDAHLREYLRNITLADIVASAPRNGAEFAPGVAQNARAGCAGRAKEPSA